MLVLSELWPKIDFFLVITKKRPLSRNVDIKRFISKKRFLHSYQKNRPFLWNNDIFGHMGYSELFKNFDVLQRSIKICSIKTEIICVDNWFMLAVNDQTVSSHRGRVFYRPLPIKPYAVGHSKCLNLSWHA